MVAPLVAAAVAAPIVGGLIQWYNSNEARKASAAERERIAGLIDQMQDPQFDFSDFNPQDFQVVEKYVPEAAKVIEEQSPQLVRGESADAKLARSARLGALGQFMSRAQSGKDPLFDIQQAEAQRQALDQGNIQRMNLEQESQRRGIQGSGIQQAARLAAIGQQQDMLAKMGMQAAAESENRRNQAMGQAAGLAGNIYGEELGQEELNSRMINDFNQRMGQRRQDVSNLNIANRNEANRYNVGTAQDISNRNVGARNVAGLRNIDNKNSLKQNMFNNQAQKVGLQVGQGDRNLQGIAGDTAQRNQAVQGMADIASKGAMYADQRNQAQEDRELRKQRGY